MALVTIVFHEDRILGHRDNIDIVDITDIYINNNDRYTICSMNIEHLTDICIRDVERYRMRINGHLEIFLN